MIYPLISDLLLLGLSTVLLDAFDFSVLLTVSILFFAEIGRVMAYFTTLGLISYFCQTMLVFPSLATVSVVLTNAFLL